ncbi:MAG: prolipoprotein diacylglyceryl transferase [Algicola sp.]|nr:prolipoprotein diacylglyceryl transferase [Algicola sp.]
MQKLKQRWEIQKNWQFLFPILGTFLNMLTAYLISRSLLHAFGLNNTGYEWFFTLGVMLLIHVVLIKFFLWCFKKLENKWKVDYKWEMIAIFIVFAITGSLSGKLAGPLVHWLGLDSDNVPSIIYWTLRILLIFPIYQILLVLIGWLFGQYQFFWNFEKKMLKRMGLGALLP